jgi:hypothetical protein
MDFVGGMKNDATEPRQETKPGSENIRERLQTLAQKTAALNESIAHVEKNLKGASGEPSSAALSD